MKAEARMKARSAINQWMFVLCLALACIRPAFCGEFEDAAKSNDVQKVKALLAKGVRVNEQDRDANGRRPLHWAGYYNAKEVAVLLISQGADVNAKDNHGQTPLFDAIWGEASTNDAAVATLLIAKGADVMVKDDRRQTPLDWAAAGNAMVAAAMLIDRGADINATDQDGLTPLHTAARFGHKEVSEYLLSKGADPNRKDNKGLTPLQWAISGGYPEIATLLQPKDFNVNSGDQEGNTLLHHAALTGTKEEVEGLLAKGADANAKNYTGATPLDFALQGYHVEIAKLLLAKGAGVNATGDWSLGWLAEQDGKSREAFVHYSAAFTKMPDGFYEPGFDDPFPKYGEPFDSKERWRQSIIKLALKLDPQPAVPEEAEKHMAHGRVAIQVAEGEDGLKDAANEFYQAAKLAPWWADAYFNLGIAFEKSGQESNYKHFHFLKLGFAHETVPVPELDNAMASYKYFLMAAPDSSESRSVKSKIYEIEFLREKIEKAANLVSQAEDLIEVKNYEVGIEKLNEAIAEYSNFLPARRDLGATLIFSKRYGEAIPPLEEAIRRGDDYIKTYIWLAYAYQNTDKNNLAIEMLEKGIHIDREGTNNMFPVVDKEKGQRDVGNACYNLGWLYQQKGDVEKSRENYRRAEELGYKQ